ncbi:MAG: hypothetical protein ABI442_01050 [Gemmatimonadaceae bacterium]
MADIPSYEQWMKDTYSLTSSRSDYLKLLDESLKTYNLAKTPDTKAKLKAALDRWRFEQSKEGKDWKKSVRNQKGAVTNLYRAVNDLDKRRLSPEELETLKYIAAAQNMAFVKQFAFADVKFKSNTLMGIAQGAGSTLQKFKTGASSAASGASTAKSAYSTGKKLSEIGKTGASSVASSTGSSDSSMIRSKVAELLRTICADLDADQVLSALHLGDVASFSADVAPLVGIISSGGKAVVAWIQVARRAHMAYDFEDRRHAFQPGDPSAAFDALLTLLDREIASLAAHAATKTVAFTGKALAAAGDFGAVSGPILGLLELLAKILQTVLEYVRDITECRKASLLLKTGPLDLSLFVVCPILGCYFLVIQDHSTIINFAVGDYGTPNFVFDVEQLVKKIDPVLSKARTYIDESRLEIPGMKNAKGVVSANYSVATGLGKATGLPGHIKDSISEKIENWIDKPDKVVVDKLRIVGFGSKP